MLYGISGDGADLHIVMCLKVKLIDGASSKITEM